LPDFLLIFGVIAVVLTVTALASGLVERSPLSFPLIFLGLGVGNQQKWDTFVKERSGGNGGVLGLPEQVVVAFALG